jgi:hypothetical protein
MTISLRADSFRTFLFPKLKTKKTVCADGLKVYVLSGYDHGDRGIDVVDHVNVRADGPPEVVFCVGADLDYQVVNPGRL